MKPIIFSTPMVQAILDGKKTQTRRVIKIDDAPENWKKSIAGTSIVRTSPYDAKLSRYASSDILWVRETWRDRWGMAYANYGTGNAYPIDDVREIEYKAGGNGFFMHGCNLCPDEPTVKWGEWSKWRPSIHMPRKAARIFLRVTNVRVERLQDITEEDAIAEGISWLDEACYSNNGWTPTLYDTDSGGSPVFRDGFAVLWDSLNAKRGYGWETNPWVWVIEFEKISKEEEERLEGLK